jgi:hypothetical protein
MPASCVTHLERIRLDNDLRTALDAFAKLHGIGREEVILNILRDWLTAINALPYHETDELSEICTDV